MNQLNIIRKNNYDIIIISDYAKGMITKELIDYIKSNFSSKIIVDPKPKNISYYSGVFMITPNEKEYSEIQNNSVLQSVENILITKGKHGMTLFDSSRKSIDIESEQVEVFNVSGAGDTVVSTLATCISMGIDIEKSCRIANKCAAYVVTKPDTTTVPKNLFKKYLEQIINKTFSINGFKYY
jgi:rfaE bifunctional protein kinase chain/domain